MARDGIDLSELDAFTDRLIQSSKEASKAQRKFLQQQGNKLKRKTIQKARAEVNKTRVVRPAYEREAGTYHKSIKRGKVYMKNGAQCIRVYSYDPVAHLIEDGWTPKARDGSSGKHQDGSKIFSDTWKDFTPEYERASEEAVDEMIRKI